MAHATEGEGAGSPGRLCITRIFDAPRELVWRAWTRPEMLIAWYGPPDWPAVHIEQDLSPGGRWRACLRSPADGRVLWQGGRYCEVVPPEKLVFTFKWESDDHEDGAPVDTLVTVLLRELPGGRTRMDFLQTGLKSETSVGGHRHGWTTSFDRLEHWLHADG
ncbi:activator of Hsp90 ATPase 1 family protein [Sphingomonas sp. MM-1]|uniref:SRPBCC family protein n=1 Tax=Sphingomonas sp. MM-1 TaxID=745310 RepID=UPI0002C08AE7|nr:SRPBCC domain-containing protein [Sphingomonas sp. MM-1]AGH47922.1 activator of Hsp90 ATPase 1 family protein [Sphingomonas sp. MM-1]